MLFHVDHPIGVVFNGEFAVVIFLVEFECILDPVIFTLKELLTNLKG